MPILNPCKNPKCTNIVNNTKTSNATHCNFNCKTQHNIDIYLQSPNYCKGCSSILEYNKRKNKFCTKSCSTSYNNQFLIVSDDTKEKIRKARIGNPVGFLKNPISSQKRKDIGKSRRTQKYHSFNCKKCNKHVEDSINKKYCSRNCWLSSDEIGGYRPNSTKKTKSIYKTFSMDSGSETAFAKLLDQNQVIWIKNTTTFFSFIDSNNKNRKYYPDFYLPEYDLWVEIKGKFWIREDDDLRLKSVPNIILLMSDKISNIITILQNYNKI